MSSTSKLHHCPHECGCTYASKKLSHVKRHTGTRHWVCSLECPVYGQIVTSELIVTKQVERRNKPAVQECNEQPVFQEPTIPNPKPHPTRHVADHFSGPEELYFDHREFNSSNEGSGSDDPDPPPSHTKPDGSRMAGRSKNSYGKATVISNREANRAILSHSPKILPKARATMSVFDPPHRRTKATKLSLRPGSSKQASTPSQPTSLTPTRPTAPAKLTPPSIGPTGEPSIMTQEQPSLPQLSPPNTTSTPLNTNQSPVDPPKKTNPRHPNKVASQPIGESTPPEETTLEQPEGLVDVTSNSNPDDVTVADTSPSPEPDKSPSWEPDPSQNGTPRRSPTSKSLPTQSAHHSPEPDIESLYASPSPKKTVTELVPIELDSDPDFETMERMLSSHRGPLSQSQPVKTEPTAQLSALSQAERPLKRQRSYSPDKSSQAPTRSHQANSRSTKRVRVNGSYSPNSTVVLNDRRKHPEFWDLDGTVILQVDNVLFRVMRSTLSKASPWFRHLFSEELDHLEIMAGCPVYTIEDDFSHLDFANLLRGLENGL